MHLAGIAELLFDRGGGGRLQEFAEARAGVGESPGGQFDVELVECGDDRFVLAGGEHSQGRQFNHPCDRQARSMG